MWRWLVTGLAAIVSGKDTDPIPAILKASLGDVGAKIFLLVALTAFSNA